MPLPSPDADSTATDRPHFPPDGLTLIKSELVKLVAAVRDADEAFDALDNHIDPARRELLALLARLRRSNRAWRRKFPLQHTRPGLRFTKLELASLAASRDWLATTGAGRAVRAIVTEARNRYPSGRTPPLLHQAVVLSLTDHEWIDLADAWAELPLDFEKRLQEVKAIHRAAKERQHIQSGFALIRAARIFMESAQRDAARSGSPRAFTQEEIDLACTARPRLDASEQVQAARRLLDVALERYDQSLATGSAPIGLLVSPSELGRLAELRDEALADFGQELQELAIQARQPATAVRVDTQIHDKHPGTRHYALRFDGCQTAITAELSGLQFWSEFLLESYYLPLTFNAVISP